MRYTNRNTPGSYEKRCARGYSEQTCLDNEDRRQAGVDGVESALFILEFVHDFAVSWRRFEGRVPRGVELESSAHRAEAAAEVRSFNELRGGGEAYLVES